MRPIKNSIDRSLPHSRDPSLPKPNVCRRLSFSSDKPTSSDEPTASDEPKSSNDDNIKRVQDALQKDLEEQQKKWNFNVTTEKTLDEDGPIKWTEGDGERYDFIGRTNAATEETMPKKSDQCDNSDKDQDRESKVRENGKKESNF